MGGGGWDGCCSSLSETAYRPAKCYLLIPELVLVFASILE